MFRLRNVAGPISDLHVSNLSTSSITQQTVSVSVSASETSVTCDSLMGQVEITNGTTGETVTVNNRFVSENDLIFITTVDPRAASNNTSQSGAGPAGNDQLPVVTCTAVNDGNFTLYLAKQTNNQATVFVNFWIIKK